MNSPDYSREQDLHLGGLNQIAGTDEAGRGPLAGPVVAAAVILDPDYIPVGLNDSKKLTPARREHLFEKIVATCQVGICSASGARIDQMNILAASLWAMKQAISALPVLPDFVLVDGKDIPANLHCAAEAMIKGDCRSVTIAAASIVAKVTRDRLMRNAHNYQPQFGFDTHKGYGTKFHREAISAHGPGSLHRMSFAPMRHYVKKDRN